MRESQGGIVALVWDNNFNFHLSCHPTLALSPNNIMLSLMSISRLAADCLVQCLVISGNKRMSC